MIILILKRIVKDIMTDMIDSMSHTILNPEMTTIMSTPNTTIISDTLTITTIEPYTPV
jgi:hypothetical protein